MFIGDQMKKSALFFDIDGTILSEFTGEIPDSTLKAFEQAQKNGHLLFINSGRTWICIPDEIRKYPFDGYLCGCGSYLVFRDQVILESHLSLERGKEIIDKMLECGLDGIMEGTDDIYFHRDKSRFPDVERIRYIFKEQNIGIDKYIKDDSFVYDKFCVFADEKSDKEEFFNFLSKDMKIIDRGNEMYEIIQKPYSKGTACGIILKELGISLEDAYVFGDSSNDVEMFQFAKHAVAMGVHAEVLEPYTEFVTKTVEDGGIAYAMKHYGLI